MGIWTSMLDRVSKSLPTSSFGKARFSAVALASPVSTRSPASWSLRSRWCYSQRMMRFLKCPSFPCLARWQRAASAQWRTRQSLP